MGKRKNTVTHITYDLTDEERFKGENTRGLEMKDIDDTTLNSITVSTTDMSIDELRDRIHPNAEVEFKLTDEEKEALVGPDACEIAQAAMFQFFGDMLLLGKIEHDCIGKTWRAMQKWDPTTRPVKYNGNGSDLEVNGAKPKPFNWRIASKMLQVKDAPKYWRTMKEAFRKVELAALLFPPAFLDDPPAGEVA